MYHDQLPRHIAARDIARKNAQAASSLEFTKGKRTIPETRVSGKLDEEKKTYETITEYEAAGVCFPGTT